MKEDFNKLGNGFNIVAFKYVWIGKVWDKLRVLHTNPLWTHTKDETNGIRCISNHFLSRKRRF